MKVIFLGTASGAGKTTVTAMYCRYLRREGISVSPFKALNLSLNSFVGTDGREIGIGQAFQAWASGIEPAGDMNPALLKPSGKGFIQLVLDGVPSDEITKDSPMDVRKVSEKAYAAFDRLSSEFDAVVCEGSGSPAEINLMARDIANIGIIRERSVPAILVGDIERGGVFAALYGTWLLLPDDIKPMIKGFIINRFRGDASILKSGIDVVEDLTGMKFLGIIPHVSLKFPEEDSLSDTEGLLQGSSATEAFMNNIDSLLDTALKSGVDLAEIKRISDV
jgi:adenosylcobyric acid synthase